MTNPKTQTLTNIKTNPIPYKLILNQQYLGLVKVCF